MRTYDNANPNGATRQRAQKGATVPMQFTVPKDIEAAVADLNGLEALLKAKQWTKAAIVYAFTRDPSMGRPKKSGNSPTFELTPAEFAKLGINGLKDPKVVAAYRARWQQAIDSGAAETPVPGKPITLPDIVWERMETTNPNGNGDEFVKAAKAGDEKKAVEIADKVLADPKVAKAVLQSKAVKDRLAAEREADNARFAAEKAEAERKAEERGRKAGRAEMSRAREISQEIDEEKAIADVSTSKGTQLGFLDAEVPLTKAFHLLVEAQAGLAHREWSGDEREVLAKAIARVDVELLKCKDVLGLLAEDWDAVAQSLGGEEA